MAGNKHAFHPTLLYTYYTSMINCNHLLHELIGEKLRTTGNLLAIDFELNVMPALDTMYNFLNKSQLWFGILLSIPGEYFQPKTNLCSKLKVIICKCK